VIVRVFCSCGADILVRECRLRAFPGWDGLVFTFRGQECPRHMSPTTRALHSALQTVHNIPRLLRQFAARKEKTPFAAVEHRISCKDLLDGFNIPADWALIQSNDDGQ